VSTPPPFRAVSRPRVAGVVCVLNRGEVDWGLALWLRALPADVHVIGPKGNSIPRQRNLGVAHTAGDWVLFVDSDCQPPPHTLDQLLQWRVDIVGGVVLERFPPHRVAAMRTMEPPVRWLLQDLPLSGLEAVPAMGTGCLLVRRPVFERLEMPWFRCGQVPTCEDLLLEDFEFGLRCGKAGLTTFLDCGLRVGHRVQATLWPGRDGKPWVQWDGGAVDSRAPLEDLISIGETAWT